MKYHLKNIKLFGYHGLYDNEKKNGQNFILNVSYEIREELLHSTLNEEQIFEYVDYSLVYKQIKSIFFEKRHHLLETLATDIATSIKDNFEEIDTIKVEISKNTPEGCDDLDNILVTYEL